MIRLVIAVKIVIAVRKISQDASLARDDPTLLNLKKRKRFKSLQSANEKMKMITRIKIKR